MNQTDDLMRHPLMRPLIGRYQVALRAERQPSIRHARETIGMSQREYCDRYVRNLPPMSWIATQTSGYHGAIRNEHYELAYQTALTMMEGRKDGTSTE